MPALGYITFRSLDSSHLEFTARLGDADITPTDGYGGWSPVGRPRRRALTEWNGNNPLKLDIPVLFDYFTADDGVACERDIRQLEKMCGLDIDVGEPPLVEFDSAGLVMHDVHDASQLAWVIENVTWGKSDRNLHGNRTRQAVTVHVMQFVEDNVLKDDSPAAKRRRQTKQQRIKQGRKGKGAKQKTYTVRAGDTLSTIAARQLGSASRWHEIATLNNLRDPKSLRQGQVLKLP